MAKYLRDLDLYIPPDEGGEARQWALSTNFLELLYLDSLPRITTNGVSKVIIIPCRALPENPLEMVLRNPDILQLSKIFAFQAYWAADKDRRKRLALDFLQEGLVEIAKARGWDEVPFQEAYKTVLAKNIVNYRPWSEAVAAPDRRHKAQVWSDYDSERAEIYVVISRGKMIIKRELVTSVSPSDVWIKKTVGKLEWVTKNEVQLTSEDEVQSWKVFAK